MALGGFLLGSLIIYLKGMRRMMFQPSGFYYSTNLKRSPKAVFLILQATINKIQVAATTVSISTAEVAKPPSFHSSFHTVSFVRITVRHA